MRQHAEAAGREVKIGVNAFVILDATDEGAEQRLREIVEGADKEAVEGFRKAVQDAGAATGDKKGMWANSSFEDLVQYNDGFKTGLIGSRETIEAKLEQLRDLRVHSLHDRKREKLRILGEQVALGSAIPLDGKLSGR